MEISFLQPKKMKYSEAAIGSILKHDINVEEIAMKTEAGAIDVSTGYIMQGWNQGTSVYELDCQLIVKRSM